MSMAVAIAIAIGVHVRLCCRFYLILCLTLREGPTDEPGSRNLRYSGDDGS